MAEKLTARIVQVTRWEAWSDPEFRQLTTHHKLLWQYITTGPHATYAIPGLYRLTFAEIYDRVGLTFDDGLRVAPETVAEFGAWFVERKRMQYDSAVGLLRIPGCAADIRYESAEKVAGKLNKIPHCKLKDRHIEELMQAASDEDVIDLFAQCRGR